MKPYAARVRTIALFDHEKRVCLLKLSVRNCHSEYSKPQERAPTPSNALRVLHRHAYTIPTLALHLYACRRASNIFSSFTLSSAGGSVFRIQASLHIGVVVPGIAPLHASVGRGELGERDETGCFVEKSLVTSAWDAVGRWQRCRD